MDNTGGMRSQGLDILRLICMGMIVILHILGQGGVLDNLSILSTGYNIAWALEIVCIGAVDCYALISGYVLYEKQSSVKRIVGLWGEVLFYGVIIYIVGMICGYDVLCKERIWTAFFPVISRQYWYFSSYIGLLIIKPLLDSGLTHLPQNVVKKILAACLIAAAIGNLFAKDVFGFNAGYSTLWLAILYWVGGYIKKYNWALKKNWYYWLLFGCGCCFLLLFWLFLAGNILANPNLLVPNTLNILWWSVLFPYTSPIVFGNAFFLFMIFKDIKMEKYSKVCERIGKSTFAIYLIHTHPFVFEYLITNHFVFLTKKSALFLVVGVCGIASLIVVGCMMIDFLRIQGVKMVHFVAHRVTT